MSRKSQKRSSRPANATAWLCALLCWPTHAADIPWPAEPAAIFGIQLGGQAAQVAVPLCPKFSPPSERHWSPSKDGGAPASASPPISPGTFCIETLTRASARETGAATLRSAPQLGFRYEGSLLLYEGAIAALSLEFDAADFDDALQLLITRYGPPTERRTEEVENRMGARANSRRFTWAGASVRLELTERSGTLDRGVARFIHLPTSKAFRDRRTQQTQEAAGKL